MIQAGHTQGKGLPEGHTAYDHATRARQGTAQLPSEHPRKVVAVRHPREHSTR